MSDLIHSELSYQIIGLCMEIHRILGKGHKENVYTDAIEIEMQSKELRYAKEKQYKVKYKGHILDHHYYADFVVGDKVILEIKAVESISVAHVKQTLNYLAASKLKLGLVINFGEDSLAYKRVVL